MVKDTIQAVKEAEEKAAQKLKDASEEGRILIEQARNEASQMTDEAKKAVRDKAVQVQDALNVEGESYLEESVKQASEDIASLKKDAEKKADAVINMVISELI